MTPLETAKYKELLEQTKNEKAATHLWLKWKCLTDLYWFGYEVFGLKDARNRETGRRLVDPVFHGWLCDALTTKEDVMILVPRRFMKTTWVKIKLIQNILINPLVRQGLFSSTSSLVEQELADIKRMLCNPTLRELFPEIIKAPGKKFNNWERATADGITIFRDPEQGSPPQENQIEVYGVGSTVTGKHFDIHIYDDLINEKTTQTLEQINKTREWYGYIQSVLEPGGQEIYIGTPYHYSDITTFIAQEGIYDKVYKRAAIENGKIIYSYYTQKMLDKIKKRSTPYQFSCQYLCNPIPLEDQLFPPPQRTHDVLPAGKWNWYIAVDPAATTKSWSDETAMVACAVNELGAVYVEDALHFKKPGNETAELILKWNEKYSPRKIGIEFGIQEHLKYILDLLKANWEAALGKQINLPVEGIDISKRSKYDRINLTLGSFVRSGKISINYRLTDLMTQMSLYTKNYSGKDDLVDALSMIFQIVEQFSFRYWKTPLGFVKHGYMLFEDLFKKKSKNPTYEERFIS